jgi:hypothetical protein
MSKYFVAGGIYKDLKGEEFLVLVCPDSEGLPYVMVDGVLNYFRLVWQSAHLYRLEDDYTLILVAPSPEAMQRGVKAPERVTPNAALMEKLRTVIGNHSPIQSSSSCQSWRLN